MIPMNLARLLRSSLWQQGWRKEWCQQRIVFSVLGIRWWRIGGSTAPNGPGTVHRILWKEHQNSCNPVFIEVGLRLGADRYYKYFKQFGLLKKTGIDLPGRGRNNNAKPKKYGRVELATVSFGQSFQITPIQLATTVSSIINGGNRIPPHFRISVESADGTQINTLEYPVETGILSEETSKTVRSVLETVVSQGSGKNAGIEGYSIGGKTATSQTLPRGSGRYISSFLGFAPAEEILQYWGFVSSTIPRVCIMVGSLLHRWYAVFLKMYFPILESKKQLTWKLQGGKSALD